VNLEERRPDFLLTPTLRLERPLTRGGMGVLWLARHVTLGSRVVVKFLADELREDPHAADRLAREAGALASVQSPHVVHVLDHGVSPAGAPFVVMEFLEGCDLATWLREHRRMGVATVVSLVRQLALALERTHAAGFIHRDVKPSNIFLCEVGRGEPFVKLLDFGIAKAVSGDGLATRSGTVVGTPAYMSPEQLVGGTVDSRADVWALGVVTFECLTGRRPFDGETVGALAVTIHSSTRPSLRGHNPSFPLAIDAWFATACTVERERRFGSAIRAADALAAALGVSSAEMASASSSPAPAFAAEATHTSTERLGEAAGILASLPHPRSARALAMALALATAMLLASVALFRWLKTTSIGFGISRPGPISQPEETERAAPRKVEVVGPSIVSVPFGPSPSASTPPPVGEGKRRRRSTVEQPSVASAILPPVAPPLASAEPPAVEHASPSASATQPFVLPDERR
jgi:serine/threonine-protein kinase